MDNAILMIDINNHQLIFRIGNSYYNKDLLPLPNVPDESSFNITAQLPNILDLKHPALFVEVEHGWAIVLVHGHRNVYTINPIMASSPSHYEELLNEPIDAIIPFLFPILPIPPSGNPRPAKSTFLTPKYTRYYETLANLMRNRQRFTINDFPTSIENYPVAANILTRSKQFYNSYMNLLKRLYDPNIFAIGNVVSPQESYNTLLHRLYGLDIKPLNNLISFQEATDLFSQSKILGYEIDLLLQPWAGPPGTPNRIVVLFGKNGKIYLIKARYDSRSKQIFSPV